MKGGLRVKKRKLSQESPSRKGKKKRPKLNVLK